MMFDVRIDRFRIGLTEPIQTARGSIFVREGAVFVVQDEAGHWGRGEVAPLPGWSSVDTEEALRHLEDAAAYVRRWGFEGAAVAAPPEVRAAVDSARWSLDAAVADVPLWRHLGGADGTVSVNALVVGALPNDLATAARLAVEDGWGTIKVKLGMGDDPERLKAVAGAIDSHTRVRLDANAAWATPEALDRLGQAAAVLGDRLEYVEDPVASLDELAVVRGRLPVPLAVDELVRTDDQLGRVIADELADVVVVKPALLGGVTSTLELAAQAHAGGLDVVLSSIYDGPVGLALWCHLAAALGGPRAHGLGTATLLADAGAAHLVPRSGQIALR